MYTTRSLSPKLATALLFIVALLLSVSAVWAQGSGGGRTIGFFDVLLLPRVWIGALFCLGGLILLMKERLSRNLRLSLLLIVFFVFGALALICERKRQRD